MGKKPNGLNAGGKVKARRKLFRWSNPWFKRRALNFFENSSVLEVNIKFKSSFLASSNKISDGEEL